MAAPESPSSAVPPRAARASGVRFRIVGLLMATAFLCHFNRISMSVAGSERIMSEYGISEQQMGTIYFAYLVVYTLFMIPGGWVIDRWGAKFALAAMGLGAAMGITLTGCIGWWIAPVWVLTALLIVRSLTGMVSVPMHPGAARAVAAWMPQRSRAGANAWITCGALLGVSSSYYVFGQMIDRFGWPLAFVVSGAVTLGLTSIWILYAARGPAEHGGVNAAELQLIVETPKIVTASSISATADAPSPWHFLLRNRSLWLATFSYATVGYVQYLFFYWLEYYFNHVLKLSQEKSRLYSTIPMLAMAAGMLVGGNLTDRLCRRVGTRRGRATVAVLGMSGGAVALLLAALATEPLWIVAGISCAMGSIGLSEGAYWATAVELGGAQGGSSAAFFNTGGNTGGFISPVLTPWLSAQFGWQTTLPIAAAVCLFGGLLWLWIDPQERVQARSVLDGNHA